MSPAAENVAIGAKPTCRQCGSPYFRHVGGDKRCAKCGLSTSVVLARDVKVEPVEDAGPIKVMGPPQMREASQNREPTVLEAEMQQPKPAKARK